MQDDLHPVWHAFGLPADYMPRKIVIFSEDDEVINFVCDLSVSDHYRANIFNFAAHRRPEHYRMIVERTGAQPPA